MKLYPWLLNSSKSSSNTDSVHKIRATVASRLINPELYIKPNKHVVNFGVAALAGCVMYFVYMISTTDPKKSKKEKTFSAHTGKISSPNKWD